MSILINPYIFASPAGGDFPVIEGHSVTNAYQSGLALVPPGTVVAGQLLLALSRTTTSADVPTASTGWTKLTGGTLGGGDLAYWGRIAGADADDTLTFGSIGGQFAAIMLRISGNRNDLTTGAIARTLAGNTNNVPALTPSWGSAKTLWIGIRSARLANYTYAPKSGYTAIVTQRSTNFQGTSSSTAHCTIACSQRAEETDTQAVATNGGGSNNIIVGRLAIRPL